MQATVGLRTETICDGVDSPACITAHNNEPGMLGVRIWGFQSFEESEQINMPGLQGLPVRVQVVHNVPLVVYGALLPNVHLQVRSAASGINEGVQVGWGNQPPPTFGAVPPPVPPGTALPTPTVAPTPTPGGPTPTPTPLPNYTITLNFETALNELPDDRSHVVIARVQDESGNNIAGARVTFRTDFGSFSVSGVGTPSIIVSTDANGLARTTLYTNRPGTSLVIAWLNYDNDGEVDPEEPVDTATKIWEAPGPYLIVSNHNPIPNDWLAVSVMDHPPTGNPHSLWWCPTLVTSTQVIAQLDYPVNVDPITWDFEDVPVQVPLGVAGRYRIESHSGDGGANACGQGTLVAYSGAIEIAAVPPDLIVESVTVVDEAYIRVGEPVTLVITVTNQSPVAVNTGPFDVDIYMPQDDAPQVQQMGLTKQWAPNLPALGSFVLTTTVTLYDNEPQQLWVQADTTNYVDEGEVGGEDNNVYGPVILQAAECVPLRGRTDDFSSGWTGMTVPDGSYSIEGGRLVVYPVRGEYYNRDTADRRGGYTQLYQPATVSGNFQVTVRVDNVETTYEWARAGLVVQAANDFNSVRFALLKFSDTGGTRGVQTQWRTSYAGDMSQNRVENLSSPIYLRITREGNIFRSFTSPNGTTNWTQRRSETINAMPANVIVGLVTSGLWFDGTGNSRITGPAIYDDFEMCSPPGTGCTPIAGRADNFDGGLGGQWVFENVALPPASSSAGGGSLSVTPGWGEIWNNSDGFYYFHQQPVSGDFRMTVRVVDVQTNYEWAKSGLMARESLLAESAHFSIMKLQAYGRGIGAYWRDATGNTSGGSRTDNFGAPYYLRMEREGNTFTAYRSEDGDNWIRQGSPRNMSLTDGLYVGVATSGHDYRTSTTLAPAIYDEFELCAVADGSVSPPTPPTIYPPGLTQCAELLSAAGFEGNPDTVFALWKAGDLNDLSGAFQRTSAQFRRGSFSIRLHASNGVIPCGSSQFQPYLYQQVTMPTAVFTFSTVTVSGFYFVERSTLECSLGTTYDSDDVLSVNLYPEAGGAALLAPQTIINGGSPSGTWYPVQIDLEAAMVDPSAYAGQPLRMQWNGFNDADVNGTFFYLDDLSMQVCTTWPVPPDEPDTASVGGLIRTRGQNNIPVIVPGADVWAYAQGGEVLHTRSIHDGTYHFYNITPGTYVIYAEAWMSGQLRTATTQITMVANERNYNINLLLQ